MPTFQLKELSCGGPQTEGFGPVRATRWTLICTSLWLVVIATAASHARDQTEDACHKTNHPFKTITACEGWDDSWTDPRFVFSVEGLVPSDTRRCQQVHAGDVPDERASKGWKRRGNPTSCRAFGLPPGQKCLAMARMVGLPKIEQFYVEGYDRHCQNGIVLKASSAKELAACRQGQRLTSGERQALTGAHRNGRALKVTDTVWRSGVRAYCRYIIADDLRIPSYRLDVRPGMKLRIARLFPTHLVSPALGHVPLSAVSSQGQVYFTTGDSNTIRRLTDSGPTSLAGKDDIELPDKGKQTFITSYDGRLTALTLSDFAVRIHMFEGLTWHPLPPLPAQAKAVAAVEHSERLWSVWLDFSNEIAAAVFRNGAWETIEIPSRPMSSEGIATTSFAGHLWLAYSDAETNAPRVSYLTRNGWQIAEIDLPDADSDLLPVLEGPGTMGLNTFANRPGAPGLVLSYLAQSSGGQTSLQVLRYGYSSNLWQRSGEFDFKSVTSFATADTGNALIAVLNVKDSTVEVATLMND